MNKPATVVDKALFQMNALKIPALNAINVETCIENYLHTNIPQSPKVIIVDEYAYKLYPYKHLIQKEQYQMEFANEFTILRES